MAVLNFEQVEQFKNNFTFVPVSKEVYCDTITPISLMRRLAENGTNYFLLESVVNGKDIGRYSFLGHEPRCRVYCKGKKVFYSENNETRQLEGEPIQVIKQLFKQYRAPKIENLPTFTGGFVGYFSYEMISLAEPKLTIKESEFPEFDLMFYDKVIAFDHLKQKVCIIANVELKNGKGAYDKALSDIEKMERKLSEQTPLKKCVAQEEVEFSCNMTKEQFCYMVDQVKEHIHEGDVFQTVVSRRFEAPYTSSLINTYRVMRTINPSPYMYYLKSEDTEIAGVSPETLVKLIDGKLTTFPVAGTRKRGSSKQEDHKLEIELLEDPKELAEHNMLVDLARNDIGRLSELGTVNVEEYMQIHRFSKVMHIASVVTGKIKEQKDAIDTITTMLPAGTLSGAPKFRACELIDELENQGRGVYAGAIGYIDMSGNADVCIGIRTAVKNKDKVYVQAGAGIVADSNPEEEYEESYNKAKAVLEAIQKASEVNGL